MVLSRPGMICIVVLTMGCEPQASQIKAVSDDDTQVQPSAAKRQSQMPTSTQTDELQGGLADLAYSRPTSGAELRILISDKRFDRRKGQPTPTRAEQFNADGTWWASVEETIAAQLNGSWRVVEQQGSPPEVCVSLLTKNKSPIDQRKEICRVVEFSEDRRVAKVPDIYRASVISEFDIDMLGDV
ncbi:hypothetical protein C7451_1144 [Blastomonas natatoria]|uniref:Uncharacterized protein n=1 Tax=Blastomonas natatoria TaxID=34015 RepID=A0A2V3V5F5_9SPHN|nr:hypothetical protein [Blastomonas natatoria]PXW70028.1 hypothetical protein C7451_1144 [Blastomonas natatoria]